MFAVFTHLGLFKTTVAKFWWHKWQKYINYPVVSQLLCRSALGKNEEKPMQFFPKAIEN